MNPDTHRFEQLDTDDAVKEAFGKGWKVFAIGEKVTIKDTHFTVVDISPNKLVLRPYGTDTLTARHAEGVAERIRTLETEADKSNAAEKELAAK